MTLMSSRARPHVRVDQPLRAQEEHRPGAGRPLPAEEAARLRESEAKSAAGGGWRVRSARGGEPAVSGGTACGVHHALTDAQELQSHCAALDLKFLYAAGSQKVNPSDAAAVDVVFRTSISSEERNALIMQARGLLYTPDREHFGIVPLEAMYLQTPVIAVNSGGPRETVVHGATGYLCEQSADAFGNAMWMLIQPVDDRGTLRCEAMGVAAKTRVEVTPALPVMLVDGALAGTFLEEHDAAAPERAPAALRPKGLGQVSFDRPVPAGVRDVQCISDLRQVDSEIFLIVSFLRQHCIPLVSHFGVVCSAESFL